MFMLKSVFGEYLKSLKNCFPNFSKWWAIAPHLEFAPQFILGLTSRSFATLRCRPPVFAFASPPPGRGTDTDELKGTGGGQVSRVGLAQQGSNQPANRFSFTNGTCENNVSLEGGEI